MEINMAQDVLPADAGKNPQTTSLYRLVFWILGLALGALVIGWIVLIGIGKTVPAELPVVIGTIVGGLVGVIAPGASTASKGSGS